MRLLAVLAVILLAPVPASALEIGPEGDFCAALRDLPAGEDLVLLPGDYKGGCAIRRGGSPGAPLVIRAADPQTPPRFVYPGHPVNMLEIRASDIVLRGLDFEGGLAEADGVRIMSGSHIVIEDCRFSRMGGIAVASTHASVQGLVVRRNTIVDSHATAMYFGCHDGLACAISDLIVEGNSIRGVSAPDPEIGYGIQLKLNTAGIVRGNIVLDTKGPGIMVYGARDLLRTSVVERNFVQGSRRSSGLVIGGGPAILQNNISVGNFDAGIGLENYQRRGLLRAIVVAHNTVYGSRQGGITLPDGEAVEATIVNNAVHARARISVLPEPRQGLRLLGNTNCNLAPCFAQPDAIDFSPFPGSSLVGASVPWGGVGPVTDFFGASRRWPASVGAIEKAAGPIRLDPETR